MAGQPTKYRKEYNEQVVKLCRLGATDKEIGDFFNVTETTINNWKIAEPSFFESIKRGKIEADMNVANSLYKRATGYEHTDTHFSSYEGVVTATKYTKHYAPDTAAVMAWLNNRRPQNYRSKQYTETTNTNYNHEISLEDAEKYLKDNGIDV